MGNIVLQDLATIVTACQLTYRNIYQKVPIKVLGKFAIFGSCIFVHCTQRHRIEKKYITDCGEGVGLGVGVGKVPSLGRVKRRG